MQGNLASDAAVHVGKVNFVNAGSVAGKSQSLAIRRNLHPGIQPRVFHQHGYFVGVGVPYAYIKLVAAADRSPYK